MCSGELPGNFRLDAGRRYRNDRSGFSLVWFAAVLALLLGMVGLVIDGGLLMAAHRQTQNAADAGALAAAWDLLHYQSNTLATSTATTFVQTHNGLSSATPTVNIPPTAGPYAGADGFVEVIVDYPVQTALVQALGVNKNRTVTGRAVAGYQAVSAGEGVAVLDPTARPGLDVSGGGTLKVEGRIVVNSQMGGVDENNQPVNNGNNGFSARGGQPNSATGIFATLIDVAGGVDDPLNFKNFITGNPSPLHANLWKLYGLKEPDPLLNLATPTTATGVDKTDRGTVDVTNNSANINDPSGQNTVDAVTGVVTIYPGVYDSISITGGTVTVQPGIYVVAAKKNNQNVLKITGGAVTANGVMFYNTGNNYNPDTGTPDRNDGDSPPPGTDGATLGSFQINAGMKFSPIDTTKYSYQNPNIYVFNGMLFYQRRKNPQGVTISGNSSSGNLAGTLYAKWANFQISGQGTYDAQFVAGSLSVTGQGNVTLKYAGKNLGKANAVFLVE